MNTTQKESSASKLFLSTWHPYAWLALIGFILYARVLFFSNYTHYDDYYLIVESHSFIDKLSDIGHAFVEDVGHQGQGGNLYRPLLTISFILSSQLSGTAPWGYHLVDILLHCLSCGLLFAALQLIGIKRAIAFLGSLVFCVHPALAQAVAWISGRNDSLLAVFILSCFITFSKYISTNHVKWYFYHLLFLALAVFTKETAIIFPILLLTFYILVRKEKIFTLKTALLLVGWGIVLANWHVLRVASQVVSVAHPAQAVATIWSNLWITLYYFGKIFWPLNPAFAPVSADMHITTGIISLGILLILIFFSKRKDWRLILFSVLWFGIFLVPTFYYHSEIHGPAKFYEHRIYVPFIGIWFVLLSLSFTRGTDFIKRIGQLFLVILIGSFCYMSYSHCTRFKDSLTLFEYDSETSPNDPRIYKTISRMEIPKKLENVMRSMLGTQRTMKLDSVILTKSEVWAILDTLKSRQQFEQQNSEFLHAFAIASFARGFLLQSEQLFLTAIQQDTVKAYLHYNLGVMYYDAHMKDKAEEEWRETVRIDSTMGKAHLNLAYFYYEAGQYAQAWVHCQKTVQLGIEIPPSLVDEIQRKNFSVDSK